MEDKFNKSKKNKFNKFGFTLIEILVVSSIIAFVATAAIVLVQGARENGRIAGAKQYASTIDSKIGTSMIGWWTFNEGTGNNVSDSWAKNDGCTTGSLSWVDGISGKALLSSSLYIPSSGASCALGTLSPAITSNDITITAWFKTTDVYGTIFALGRSTAPAVWKEGIGITGEGNVVGPDGSDAAKSIKIYADDKWHFVAARMGAAGIQIWVDGVPDGYDSTPVDITYNEYLRVLTGTGNHWGALSPGTIDEVKLYNESLTAREIQKLYAESVSKYLASK